MKLVNLTPHPVHLYGTPADGNDLVLHEPIPSVGVARVAASTEVIGSTGWAHGPVPIIRQTLGQVEGLPAPVDGTRYIVSRMVALAATDRRDLLVPADIRIMGAAALEVLHSSEH